MTTRMIILLAGITLAGCATAPANLTTNKLDADRSIASLTWWRSFGPIEGTLLNSANQPLIEVTAKLVVSRFPGGTEEEITRNGNGQVIRAKTDAQGDYRFEPVNLHGLFGPKQRYISLCFSGLPGRPASEEQCLKDSRQIDNQVLASLDVSREDEREEVLKRKTLTYLDLALELSVDAPPTLSRILSGPTELLLSSAGRGIFLRSEVASGTRYSNGKLHFFSSPRKPLVIRTIVDDWTMTPLSADIAGRSTADPGYGHPDEVPYDVRIHIDDISRSAEILKSAGQRWHGHSLKY